MEKSDTPSHLSTADDPEKNVNHPASPEQSSMENLKDLDPSRIDEKDLPPESPAKAQPANPWLGEFPEGTRKGWLAVAGGAACLFVSFGWVNCIGVFQDYYQTHQLSAYTPSEVAWIPALQIFFMLSLGPFIGKVFDEYGPQILLIVGTFMHVFGLMMVSISKTYYQILLSQAICSAIGASMVFNPAVTCVATWFKVKRGAAMGLVTAGSSLGGVIFPVMVIKLLPQVGFGWTMRICAFLILALLIFANFTVKSRFPPSHRPFSFKAYGAPLKTPVFVVLVWAIFFFFWGMFIPFTFIVVEASAKGFSYELANYLVPILNAASIFGRTIPNALADRYGRFNMMIAMSLLTTVLLLGFWLPATGHAAIITFTALIGFSTGAGISLSPVLAIQLAPIKDVGVWTGMLLGFASIAALTGSPIGGAIVVDSHGDFKWPIVFAGVSCAIGTVLFVITRILLGGPKVMKKV